MRRLLAIARSLAFVFGTLDVEKGLGCFGIAKGNLAQAAGDDELRILGLILGGLDGPLDLLLHSLDMVLRGSTMASHASVTASGLEQVRLRKVAKGLTGVMSLASSDVTVNLIVEVLGYGGIRVLVARVSSSRYELLQLDPGDEVFVLRRHQPVVLGQEPDLVIAFRPLRLLVQEGCFLFLRHLHDVRMSM